MAIKQTFQASVAKRINKDKDHGWGVEDSLAVVIDLLIDETGSEEIRENKELVAAVKEVINPSQFRQKLESAKILNKSKTKDEKVESLLSDFNA